MEACDDHVHQMVYRIHEPASRAVLALSSYDVIVYLQSHRLDYHSHGCLQHTTPFIIVTAVLSARFSA